MARGAAGLRMSGEIYAGVETGGTKTLCRVVRADGAVVAEARWPTAGPDEMAEVLGAFIGEAAAAAPVAGVGLAAFGPIVVDPARADRGRVLATPKPGWTGSNLAQALAARLGAPVAVETDVNAAAIAEQRLGAGRGAASVAYVTVGTGIGGGLAIEGRPLRGALHPEIGHLRLARRADDAIPSACPFHSDCAEGLAAGPAIGHRLAAGQRLQDEPQTFEAVADYLAQLVASLVLAWSPERVVLGGGVLQAPGLLARVAEGLPAALGGYGVGEAALSADFIVPAALEHAGLEGALILAREQARAREA